MFSDSCAKIDRALIPGALRRIPIRSWSRRKWLHDYGVHSGGGDFNSTECSDVNFSMTQHLDLDTGWGGWIKEQDDSREIPVRVSHTGGR